MKQRNIQFVPGGVGINGKLIFTKLRFQAGDFLPGAEFNPVKRLAGMVGGNVEESAAGKGIGYTEFDRNGLIVSGIKRHGPGHRIKSGGIACHINGFDFQGHVARISQP